MQHRTTANQTKSNKKGVETVSVCFLSKLFLLAYSRGGNRLRTVYWAGSCSRAGRGRGKEEGQEYDEEQEEEETVV